MPVVTNTVKYPNGTVAAGRVTIDLVGENGRPVTDGSFVSASDYAIAATYAADLSAGVWSATLVANSLISPSGTRWRVQESVDGRVTTYYLNVPNGAGPYFVEDILDEAPGTIESSALAAHEADTGLHSGGGGTAATTTFDDSGLTDVVGDDVQAALEAVDMSLAGVFSEPLVTAVDAATVTFDLSAGSRQIVTLGGNRTFAVTNDAAHPVFTIIVATGAGSFNPTWWSGIRWVGGSTPTVTPTASKYDVFSFIRVSVGVYLGFVVGQSL